jgi:signal transduction histidine kinase
MNYLLKDLAWGGFVPVAQLEGVRIPGETSTYAAIAALFFVGLFLALFVAFRASIAGQRLRAGVRMLGRAASTLAEDRDYSAIGAGSDPDLVALGDAFNRISRHMADDAMQLEREGGAERELTEYVERYQGAIDEMARITDSAELHTALVRSVIERFEFEAASLWLMHRFVRAPAAPGLEEQTEDKDGDAQDALRRVGLLPVGRGGVIGAESGPAPVGYPYGGILEAATTGEPVLCDRLDESPLFVDAAGELGELGLIAYGAIPLQLRGRVLGVLEVFSGRPFSPFERRFLRMIATAAASLVSLAYGEEEAARTREAAESRNLELQMANRQLQRTNSQLTEADRLKGEFLANTSHELRTPLNSILGFAQLILAGASDSEEEVRSNVEAIYESGERLLKLINEVLDLAKIEAGRLNLSLAPVDVRPVIDAAYTLLRVQAEAKGILLNIDIPRTELSAVRADHTKLYQILVNLVGNAVKFTESGSVTVRVIPEAIPGFMVIEVEDTGIGVSPEVLSRLFQKFVQGDGSVTRKFGGTGLGLAISQKMADLQGGALTLSSPGEGKGAVASLVLPLWSDRLETEVSRSSIRPRPGEFPPQGRSSSSRTISNSSDILWKASNHAAGMRLQHGTHARDWSLSRTTSPQPLSWIFTCRGMRTTPRCGRATTSCGF